MKIINLNISFPLQEFKNNIIKTPFKIAYQTSTRKLENYLKIEYSDLFHNAGYSMEQLKKLQKKTKNVEIKLDVSNKELEKILASSIAGLFLGYQEDFGIVPLEILAANKPLIAVDEGGYIQLIQNHPLFHKIKEKHNKEEMINHQDVVSHYQTVVKDLNKSLDKDEQIKRFRLISDEWNPDSGELSVGGQALQHHASRYSCRRTAAGRTDLQHLRHSKTAQPPVRRSTHRQIRLRRRRSMGKQLSRT